MDRGRAESDNDHKQVIAYIVVRRGRSILAYRRGVYNRTEDMLKGCDCVGFGGHVSDRDFTLFATDRAGIVQAAVRELTEELALPAEDRWRLSSGEGLSVIGLLNDDSSAVGRRHFAVVLEYVVSNSPEWDNPRRGEESITQLRWIDTVSGEVRLSSFEYWSQLVLRAFAPDTVKAQPSFIVRRRRPLTPPHILCVVGPIGSGKTEAGRVLREEFGYADVNSGRILSKIIRVPRVPFMDRSLFQAEAQRFISRTDGPRLLAEAIHASCVELGSERVLVDGIRHPSTLDELRKLAGERRVGVLFVHAPPDVAFSFYRQRENPSATVADFVRVRESPVEFEVSMLWRHADAVLYNWFGRSRYVAVVRAMMRELHVPRRSRVP
jgi:predicted NUDIX family phosphoesterase/dephospho-CoA kinase